jgi:hypothetical protein
MSLGTSITVDRGINTDGLSVYWIKIQADTFELNVRVRPEEVAGFERVPSTPWTKGALPIGTAAGSRAFWCVSDNAEKSIVILVGHDDQTWDFAVSLPHSTIDMIRGKIAECQ